MQKIVIGIVVALALIAGLFLFMGKRDQPSVTSNDNVEPGSLVHDVDGVQTGDMMRTEDNAVVATEQRPGSSVTMAQIVLAAPGYVVIHEDNNGAPGAILGSSALLQAGQSSKVKVTLSRATKNGEKLHAMLHSEMNGNSTFEVASDAPVQSRMGGPIEGWFEISATAEENIEVTL